MIFKDLQGKIRKYLQKFKEKFPGIWKKEEEIHTFKEKTREIWGVALNLQTEPSKMKIKLYIFK